jgi:hypothetical protein
MFAPKPFAVAKEMVRVTRPGERIAMGNWISNDPTLVAQILKISAAYTPPGCLQTLALTRPSMLPSASATASAPRI